ncbi:poly(A)-binding protein binding protein [Tilletia horrida]|nr:poly(A)-binding protein binding protein [Tilletia horrida]
MAAPSFKSRGGASINTAGRGGRGGNSLGANSRWSSGPPRPLNSNNSANNGPAAPGGAGAAATPAPAPAPAPASQEHQQTPVRAAAAPAGNTAAGGPQSPNSAFPSLGGSVAENTQAKMHERIVFLLASLVGTMVIVTARGGIKYVGLLSAASTEQGELGISLASAQQMLPAASADAAPELGAPKGAMIVLGRDLDEIEAFDVKIGDSSKEGARQAAERDSFRTDTDISKTQFDALGGGRVLQKWSDDPGMDVAEAARAASMGLNGSTSNRNLAFGGLEDTSSKASGGAWDQFAVNERHFGVKSNYDEDIYTTKLDRSGKDFKERERNAERIAKEILNASTNNPHMAEERNQIVNSAGTADEEAKYGAVLRGPNAYVPPAARRAGGGGALNPAQKVPGGSASTSPSAGAGAPVAAAAPAKPALPKSGGAAAPAAAGASGAAAAAASAGIKPPTVVLQSGSNDATPELASKKVAPGDVSKEFSKFVSSERERMHAKRKEVQKKEMQNELLALKLWHGNFQLKTPIPENLDSPLRNKNKANVSEKPRDPNLQKSLSPNATHADATRAAGHALNPLIATTAESSGQRLPPFNRNVGGASSSSGLHALSRPAAPKISIAKIPPFDPERFKARQAELKKGGASAAAASTSASASGSAAAAAKPAVAPSAATAAAAAAGAAKVEPPAAAAKLSAKASAFKPFNPNATAFTPGAPGKKVETPAAATTAPAAPANPFFGTRILKKPASHAPLHVREEFNPFKVSKVPEAVSISPEWRFTGKNYRQLFTAVPPPTPAAVPLPANADESFTAVHPQPPVPQPGMMPAMVPAGAHPPHGPPPPMQPHHPGPQLPHTGPPAHSAGPPQQIGMPFAGQPQFYPRFPQQPQHFPQQMHMPANQGMPHYGAMPPSFVPGMPFSPPMPPHGGHPVYSPQMANMPPPGQHGQFMPQPGPMPGPMPGGPPHGPGGGPPRGGPGGPPPHMQKGPPQMYFQQPGPVHGMPYGHGPHFIPGGPGGRPGMPPMDGSFPGVGGPHMGDPGNM